MLKHRNGERLHIFDLIEIVVYSKLGTPDIANDFEINFGGMRFNPSIDYKQGEEVVVRLFMESLAVLDLYGLHLRGEEDGTSVVKFEPMNDMQRLIFSKTLEKCQRHN